MRVLPFMRQGHHHTKSSTNGGGSTVIRSRSSGPGGRRFYCSRSSAQRCRHAVRDAAGIYREASSSTGPSGYLDQKSATNNLG